MQALPTHRGSDRHRALRLRNSTLAARLSTAARASSSDGRLRRAADERSRLALERHLAENWKPLGEDRYSDAPALVVNFPFGWRRIPSRQ